ncbi:GNAT family N-acetyltransferase, partial [Microcoleus sp. HI-ES]|nr:GNAT family N-acetyltransferase [Microcoleus sp. HI-ES]
WEARTWLLEVNVGDNTSLALYRQNGFQPLAQMTYWTIAPERLQEMANSTPDLPNLLPVSNADAQLLYQLDTASMPPLVRQVFDRHIQDFKTSFFGALVEGVRQWLGKTEVVSGYVFEPQRKAAIGYFQVQLSRNGQQPHVAQLTVHPAYTWLYPELLSQMARLVQDFPVQSLQLASADDQPEREAYLEQFGAVRVEHSLLMSRSVWHKLRESKLVSLEGLQLSEMLQSFQPTRKPVPGRMSWLGPMAGEAAAGPASSEIKPLLTDSGNSQTNQVNPLNFQNPESSATD